jgi:hypothetical protein
VLFVAFIIIIYHDARYSECQIRMKTLETRRICPCTNKSAISPMAATDFYLAITCGWAVMPRSIRSQCAGTEFQLNSIVCAAYVYVLPVCMCCLYVCTAYMYVLPIYIRAAYMYVLPICMCCLYVCAAYINTRCLYKYVLPICMCCLYKYVLPICMCCLYKYVLPICMCCLYISPFSTVEKFVVRLFFRNLLLNSRTVCKWRTVCSTYWLNDWRNK